MTSKRCESIKDFAWNVYNFKQFLFINLQTMKSVDKNKFYGKKIDIRT